MYTHCAIFIESYGIFFSPSRLSKGNVCAAAVGSGLISLITSDRCVESSARGLWVNQMSDAISPLRDSETQRLIDELFHDQQLARAEAREFAEANKAKDRIVAMLSHEL